MRNVVGEPSLGHHKWSIFIHFWSNIGASWCFVVLHGASWCFIQDVPVFQEECNLRGITIGQIGALMCLAHSDLQYWKPSILLVDVGYKCHYITMRSFISLVVSHYSHYIPMISPLSLHFIPMFFPWYPYEIRWHGWFPVSLAAQEAVSTFSWFSGFSAKVASPLVLLVLLVLRHAASKKKLEHVGKWWIFEDLPRFMDL
jgi:hypothetical protein